MGGNELTESFPTELLYRPKLIQTGRLCLGPGCPTVAFVLRGRKSYPLQTWLRFLQQLPRRAPCIFPSRSLSPHWQSRTHMDESSAITVTVVF